MRLFDKRTPLQKEWEKLEVQEQRFLQKRSEKRESILNQKLVDKILFHYGRIFLLPYPISAAYTTIMSAKYIWKGIKTLME